MDLNNLNNSRRSILASIAGMATMTASSREASAGEVGARITKAVTTSDLGISVRTSVVKGAQFFDQVDGKWEQFSDKFGLGTARSQQIDRPKPKDVPPLLDFDPKLAMNLLKAADEAFIQEMGSKDTASILNSQISSVAKRVQPSFKRSGSEVDESNAFDFTTAEQFNFATYVHFKAYAELLSGVPFPPFSRAYQTNVGKRIAELVIGGSSASGSLQTRLDAALADVENLGKKLRDAGLVALIDRSPIPADDLADWTDDVSDLTFTVAVDDDVTLGAQLLLQEQGVRLYPDFSRFAVSHILRNCLEGASQKVTVDDYYFDTDYNSDPDKFQVKEVLLNIVLESQ